MTKVFTDCSERSILKLEKLLGEGELQEDKTIELDMEAEFSSLALDIIGLGVFNYDFGSVTKESPVIKVWRKENDLHYNPTHWNTTVCFTNEVLVSSKMNIFLL